MLTVTSGPLSRTAKVASSGVGSARLFTSTARTAIVCRPAVSTGAHGLMHVSNGIASNRHSKWSIGTGRRRPGNERLPRRYRGRHVLKDGDWRRGVVGERELGVTHQPHHKEHHCSSDDTHEPAHRRTHPGSIEPHGLFTVSSAPSAPRATHHAPATRRRRPGSRLPGAPAHRGSRDPIDESEYRAMLR